MRHHPAMVAPPRPIRRVGAIERCSGARCRGDRGPTIRSDLQATLGERRAQDATTSGISEYPEGESRQSFQTFGILGRHGFFRVEAMARASDVRVLTGIPLCLAVELDDALSPSRTEREDAPHAGLRDAGGGTSPEGCGGCPSPWERTSLPEAAARRVTRSRRSAGPVLESSWGVL